MRLRTILAATVVAASAAFAGTAVANEPLIEAKALPGTFSANVAFTSEYFFRGISQTDDRPAVQGGFDHELDAMKGTQVYLGTWASNVNFTDANIEIDYYGGLKGSVGKFGWDFGFIYYSYPGADSTLNYDFIELAGKASYDLGVASTTGGLNYSPANFGDSGNAWYASLDLEVPLGKKLTLAGHVGRQWIDDNGAFGAPDYIDYSFGVSANVLGFDLDLKWTDTDIDGCSDACGAVVFTASRSF